jgi:aldehyde:ferredoxin oxidoreductase
LTGIWGESSAGGFWGAELKFSGYDGIVVRGRSAKPVWLSIVEGQPPTLHDATGLWGLDCDETEQRLHDDLGDQKVRVASIGAAGENLVLYAAIMNDRGRAAGRTGMGAVMGSKNLKAIAVRGKQRVPLADKEVFSQTAKQALQIIKDDIATQIYELGTSAFVDMSMMWGNMPHKYWSQAQFEEASDLSGIVMMETILTRATSCYGCAVACGREVTLKDTPYGVGEVAGPEYETVAMLGSLLLVDDLPGVAYAGYLCDRYGLDTISAGSSIALAYLLYDRGFITAADTGGLSLKWGDIETAHTLLEMIAQRQGFGDILAEGTKRIAARYGADDLAVHVNGLELAAHDPRAVSGMALSYATAPRGGCHLSTDMYAVAAGLNLPEIGVTPGGRFKTRGTAKVAAKLQNWRTLFNSAIMCMFVNPTAPVMVQLLSSATGWSSDIAWWQRTGERGFNLKRALNNRLGIHRGNDRIPERLLIPMSGGSMGRTPRMEKLIEEYYVQRDWDWETGKPSHDKLVSLGLPEIAAELWDES